METLKSVNGNTPNAAERSRRELEKSPEVQRARKFFIEALPFRNPAAAEKLSTCELLELYKEYLDGVASKEHLKQIVTLGAVKEEEFDNAVDAESEGLWRSYLLGKLPREIVNNLAKRLGKEQDVLSVEELEALHRARVKSGSRLILGFSVSRRPHQDIIKPIAVPGVLVSGGRQQEMPAGRAYYSIFPDAIYRGPESSAPPEYIHLIEGDAEEVSRDREKYGAAHGKGKWVGTARPLPILASFKWNEVREALGMKYL